MAVFITRPTGHHALPYLVAQVDRFRLRIAHVVDLVEAKYVQREWERGEYSINAGELRELIPQERTEEWNSAQPPSCSPLRRVC